MNTNLRATLKYDDINIVVAPTSHTVLSDRDAAEQHPISAITGLQTALDSKADVGEFVPETDFDEYKQTVTAALADKADTSDLAAVATTGDYDDLINKPSLFSGDYNDLVNKPDLSVYAESADLSAVATSGDYDDLTDKPDLSVYRTSAAQDVIDASKITNPAGGSAGQVLTKTATGEEWADTQAESLFIITATGTGDSTVIDKSYDDIRLAINDGLIPVVIHLAGNGMLRLANVATNVITFEGESNSITETLTISNVIKAKMEEADAGLSEMITRLNSAFSGHRITTVRVQDIYFPIGEVVGFDINTVVECVYDGVPVTLTGSGAYDGRAAFSVVSNDGTHSLIVSADGTNGSLAFTSDMSTLTSVSIREAYMTDSVGKRAAEVTAGLTVVFSPTSHTSLSGRDSADSHPMSAITGLTAAIATIPTAVSELDNDSGFLTLDTLPIWDGTVI